MGTVKQWGLSVLFGFFVVMGMLAASQTACAPPAGPGRPSDDDDGWFINPANPANPLSPLNPANPASPLFRP